MQGLVTKSTGSGYRVLLDDGSSVLCHIKGNLRIRGIRTTNPVAVGDRVQITLTDAVGPTAEGGPTGEAGHVGWITDILPRRNYISRRATNLSKQAHILAANLDQVALIVTIRHPETSTTFIDRFLATAEAYRIPAVLIFNKIDLLTPDEETELADLRTLYESLDYPTYAISATNLEESVKSVFTGKVTLLAGNSGVGKSTFLNAVFGCEKTRTGHISDAHDKGMHTTTFSEMYQLPITHNPSPVTHTPSWIIDTPGIKGFGAVQMEKEEISHYFREIFRIGRECRYGNCLHTGEPGCAVHDAVVDGRIAMSRYESYISLLGDCDEAKYR